MALLGSRRVWDRAEAQVELRSADLTTRRGARRAMIRGRGHLTWYATGRFAFANVNGARLRFRPGDLLAWRMRTIAGETFIYRDVFLTGNPWLPIVVEVRLPEVGWQAWVARLESLDLVHEPPRTAGFDVD